MRSDQKWPKTRVNTDNSELENWSDFLLLLKKTDVIMRITAERAGQFKDIGSQSQHLILRKQKKEIKKLLTDRNTDDMMSELRLPRRCTKKGTCPAGPLVKTRAAI